MHEKIHNKYVPARAVDLHAVPKQVQLTYQFIEKLCKTHHCGPEKAVHNLVQRFDSH